MKLFGTRRHRGEDPVVAEFLRPPPAQRRAILLQYLGPGYGFGLRHPATNLAIHRDEMALAIDYGAMVVELAELDSHAGRVRLQASAPGERVHLAADGDRVAVSDRDGQHVGYLDDRVAAPLAAAVRDGADLRALALWESRALDGHRTDLWVLLLAPDVELMIVLEPPQTARTT